MSAAVIGMTLLVFFARIVDVSLDTLRLLAVVHSRRAAAWVLAFFQVLIWLYVVASVLPSVTSKPWLAIAYALGFATGNFVGVTIESWLAHGEQVVRVFTRRGAEMAAMLRGDGYGVTEFDGTGKDGPVSMLFIETKRKRAKQLTSRARQLDPSCFFIVDDIRLKSSSMTP